MKLLLINKLLIIQNSEIIVYSKITLQFLWKINSTTKDYSLVALVTL